jgi:hypothetical protein
MIYEWIPLKHNHKTPIWDKVWAKRFGVSEKTLRRWRTSGWYGRYIDREAYELNKWRKNRNSLSDNIIKVLLLKGTRLKRKDIPKELIQLKRMNIIITRQLRKFKF